MWLSQPPVCPSVCLSPRLRPNAWTHLFAAWHTGSLGQSLGWVRWGARSATPLGDFRGQRSQGSPDKARQVWYQNARLVKGSNFCTGHLDLWPHHKRSEVNFRKILLERRYGFSRSFYVLSSTFKYFLGSFSVCLCLISYDTSLHAICIGLFIYLFLCGHDYGLTRWRISMKLFVNFLWGKSSAEFEGGFDRVRGQRIRSNWKFCPYGSAFKSYITY
jgi:hypothetical protein